MQQTGKMLQILVKQALFKQKSPIRKNGAANVLKIAQKRTIRCSLVSRYQWRNPSPPFETGVGIPPVLYPFEP